MSVEGDRDSDRCEKKEARHSDSCFITAVMVLLLIILLIVTIPELRRTVLDLGQIFLMKHGPRLRSVYEETLEFVSPSSPGDWVCMGGVFLCPVGLAVGLAIWLRRRSDRRSDERD